MGLFTSIINAGSAFKVFSQAMETTENNVVNSSTPDYARQIQNFTALPFDPSVGLPGGVCRPGPKHPQRLCRAVCSLPTIPARLSTTNLYRRDPDPELLRSFGHHRYSRLA